MRNIQKSLHNLILVVLFLFVLTTICISALPNQVQAEDTTNVDWLSYKDPRFGFTIEYPASWIINSRDDNDLTAMSGVVSFTDVALASSESQDHQDPHKASSIQFVIGHYLAEYNPDQSLSSWKDDYVTISEANIPTEAFSRYEKHEISINGVPALLVKGESALTQFQVANIPNGKMVWFIWTNIGSSTDPSYQDIFEHVISSFKFSSNTPQSLFDIYGKGFIPQSLEPVDFDSKVANGGLLSPPLSVPLMGTVNLPAPSTWIAPIGTGTNYPVKCGSALHQDTELNKYSAYAADITMYLKWVKSSKTSWVFFAGWADGGWGNLVMANYNNGGPGENYTLHYAHLSQISVVYGQNVNQGANIGKSGDTGVPGSFHLHFHVRKSANSVNLTDMSGFYPDSDYPFNFAECGYMQR